MFFLRMTHVTVLVFFLLALLSAPSLLSAKEESTLPKAGGLQYLPGKHLEALSLHNPGFEEGREDWLFGSSDAFTVVPAESCFGESCLRFDAGLPTQFTPSVRQALPDVGPGIYSVRFWMKLQNIVPPDTGKGGVRVSVEYTLENGARNRTTTEIYFGTRKWQAVELDAHVPPDVEAGSVTLSVHRYGKPLDGVAWFDEFSLKRVLPPPVEAFLCYPNYRGYLPEDGPQLIRLWVNVNDTASSETPVVDVRRHTVSGDGGKGAGSVMAVVPVTLNEGTTEKYIELDAGFWPVGEYHLNVSLGEYQYPAYIIHKITADQRQELALWFSAEHVLHRGDGAVFPLGLYTTSGYTNEPESYVSDHLEKMSEAPINFLINYLLGGAPLSANYAYLEAQRRFGIHYLATVNNFTPGLYPDDRPLLNELLPEAGGVLTTQQQADLFTYKYAQALRTEENFAGFYVMDERAFDQVPRHFRQYQVLRAADHDHLTLGISNRPEELSTWRDTLDVIGLDPYPLINMALGRPLTLAGEETRAAVESVHGGRPVWMVIQFFQGYSSDRWPTEEELRTMSLMAVTEGARGLFYWSFGARALAWVPDPAEREEYWSRLKRVTWELKSLEPALLAADSPDVVSRVSDDRVRWRARSAEGRWYVFAYLPAEHFEDRFDAPPVNVVFTMKNGERVFMSLRPDTADWLVVEP